MYSYIIVCSLAPIIAVLVHVEEVMAIRQTNELLAVTPPDTKKLLQLKLSLEEKFKTLKQPDGGTVDEDHLMNEKVSKKAYLLPW